MYNQKVIHSVLAKLVVQCYIARTTSYNSMESNGNILDTEVPHIDCVRKHLTKAVVQCAGIEGSFIEELKHCKNTRKPSGVRPLQN